ncbi:unnamed protein product [Eruca vesicaria subsp. sativa]|uniref:Uncharacterized protein n=1 Tax=Eruca vesicaria subsp. sativa TaxID=29727 RepID=A0ABC8K415_ERUVS|nr:unnamed protein product [Eruca vesicaria subsp. sativa]
MRMISDKHDFSDHIWESEETAEFSFGVHDKQREDNDVSENDEVVQNAEHGPKNGEEDGRDDDFLTPKETTSTSSGGRKGKKRLPDHGMERRKQKVLSTRPKDPSPFNEDMKSFVANLFQQKFSAMEERLQKQMGERFEKMHSELKVSFKDAAVEVEPSPSKSSPTKPSPSKPSPSKPYPTKPSPTKSSFSNLTPSKPMSTKPSTNKTMSTMPSSRRSTRLDDNISEAEDMDIGIDMQGLEELSQVSNVPGFDPSQTNKDMEPCDWWTLMSTVQKIMVEPMQENKTPPPTKWNKWQRKLELSDSPMPSDGSPQSSLYWFNEESWDRFTE